LKGKEVKELMGKTTLSGDYIKLVILAVKKEKTREGESFSEFIKRVREKYADKLGTDRISLEAV
jgi:predicted CopG family antitoxin